MKKILVLIFCLAFLSFGFYAFAHQPRMVQENITEVYNPEISQAFYGELKGEPVYFKIQSDAPFNLYAGLLVPDLPAIKKDISAEITYQAVGGQDKLFYFLDGQKSEWPKFHEEFANDNYFLGPEYKADNTPTFSVKGKDAQAGTYTIKVFSPDNQGKYVFVVGDKEEFPIEEMWKAVKVLPTIKSQFFNQSPWSVFNSKVGNYMLVGILLIVVVMLVIVWIVVKIYRRKK